MKAVRQITQRDSDRSDKKDDGRRKQRNAQHTAEQREWETLQAMMTSRLAAKDALIATLQQQIAKTPIDPETPVENDTGSA